jgi:hypothetical protein
MEIDEKYLKSLEEFGIGVQTLDERMELIRLARVGLEVERNLTQRAVDGACTCGKNTLTHTLMNGRVICDVCGKPPRN